MDYTIEQKAVALLDCTLWWRVPNVSDEFLSKWTRVTDDIVRPEREDLLQPGTEYHIGDEPPKPPRVLSELERELLAALEGIVSAHDAEFPAGTIEEQDRWATRRTESIKLARVVISEAKGEA